MEVTPNKSHHGELVTFYSYKGGVGRSMALANVATIYAQLGKRVLAMDFDFEAPGLHRYFLSGDPGTRYSPTEPRSGVLNLFAALRDRLQADSRRGKEYAGDEAIPALRAMVGELLDGGEHLYKIQVKDPNPRREAHASLDFIPVARFDSAYPDLVRAFDWQGLYDDYPDLFKALSVELASRYDMVLIDSRTGVTDIGSICTMVLPDKLVVVFSPNEQSLSGALDAAWQAVQGRREMGAKEALPVFPLLSRVEEGEEEQRRAWIGQARGRFERLFKKAYSLEECDLRLYFDTIRVPHRGYYSFGERIAAEEQAETESGSLANVYSRFADGLRSRDTIEWQQGISREKSETTSASHMSRAAFARFAAAEQLLAEGRTSDALRRYDEVIRDLENNTQRSESMEEILAVAMASKGAALNKAGQHEDAATSHRELLRRFGPSANPSIKAAVVRSTFNLGHTLGSLGQYEEALEVLDRLIERMGNDGDTTAREAIARALVLKGNLLREQDRHADAIKIYDLLIQRYDESETSSTRTQVLRALGSKAISLADSGQAEAAALTRAEVVRRFGESPDPEHRGIVAAVMIEDITADPASGDAARSLAASEDFLRRFGSVTDRALFPLIGRAMLLQATALSGLDRKGEAFSVYQAILDRFESNRSQQMRSILATTLFAKFEHLDAAGQYEESRAICLEMIRRFGRGPDDQARQTTCFAASRQAITSFDNQKEHFLSDYNQFVTAFSDSKDPVIRGNLFHLMVLAGGFLGKHGEYRQATLTYEQALSRFEAAQEPNIRDGLHEALNGLGFSLMCEAKRLLQAGNAPDARAKLEVASTRLTSARDRKPDSEIVLGNAAYTAYLLGREEEARDLLTKAIRIGGSKLREIEIEDTKIFPLPQDEGFRALVSSIPDTPRPDVAASSTASSSVP